MITLAELKLYLWITWTDQDTLLALFVNATNGKIKEVIGYNPVAQAYIKKLNGNAQKTIITKERPLNTIAYLKEDIDGTFTPVEWDYFFTNNWIINLNFYLDRWFDNYEISYNAWYASDSVELAEIKMTAMMYASYLYNNRWHSGIKSESVSWDSITWWEFNFNWLSKYRDVL